MRDGPVRDIGGVRRSGHPWTIRSRISERSALFRAVHAPAHARRLRSCSRRGRGRTPRSGRRRRPGALTAPRVSAAGRRRSRACRPTEKAVAHDARHGAARPGFTSTVGPRRPSRHPGGSRAGPGACRPWRSPPTRARWRPSRRRPRSRRTRRDRRRTVEPTLHGDHLEPAEPVSLDRQVRRHDEVERVFVPDLGLRDQPLTRELLRSFHEGAVPSSTAVPASVPRKVAPMSISPSQVSTSKSPRSSPTISARRSPAP